MMFYDRNEAGRLLSQKLATYAEADASMLALPRASLHSGSR